MLACDWWRGECMDRWRSSPVFSNQAINERQRTIPSWAEPIIGTLSAKRTICSARAREQFRRSLCSDQVGAIPRSAHPRGRYGPAWSGPFGFFFSFLIATFFFYGNFYDLFLI
jgi:hypothetical protein